jgi:hypothetical protein
MPIQTYFNSNTDGTLAMCITADSKYISTLSSKLPQKLSIWEWTNESDKPVCSIQLPIDYDLQKIVRFNNDNVYQLITNGDNQAMFFEWNLNDGLKYFAPKINDTVRFIALVRVIFSTLWLFKDRITVLAILSFLKNLNKS